MLTLAKIKLYESFNGDIDGWARMHEDSDSSEMTDSDWFLIDKIIQGLFLISENLASPEFSKSVESNLLECTVDDETRAALRKLIKIKI